MLVSGTERGKPPAKGFMLFCSAEQSREYLTKLPFLKSHCEYSACCDHTLCNGVCSE